jgi:hypothetical protein
VFRKLHCVFIDVFEHPTPTTSQSTAPNPLPSSRPSSELFALAGTRPAGGRTPSPLPTAHDQRDRGGRARGRYPRPLCPCHVRNEAWWQVPVAPGFIRNRQAVTVIELPTCVILWVAPRRRHGSRLPAFGGHGATTSSAPACFARCYHCSCWRSALRRQQAKSSRARCASPLFELGTHSCLQCASDILRIHEL